MCLSHFYYSEKSNRGFVEVAEKLSVDLLRESVNNYNDID